MPDYPQCELRLARFRGTNRTEFLDQRHFPMPARVVPGQMRRMETLLIAPDAMREILVNALIHRDYSIAGGAVSLAIFDDRVEVWSAGSFPKGITAASLTRKHQSVQRNPLIADVFHRTGLIEKWGRGTNRVVDMCRDAGIAQPKSEEITGAAVVTFRVLVGETAGVAVGSKAGSRVESKVGSAADLPSQVLAALRLEPLSKAQIAVAVEKKKIDGQLHAAVREVLARGLAVSTLPDKPHSRLQKYRLTADGRNALTARPGACVRQNRDPQLRVLRGYSIRLPEVQHRSGNAASDVPREVTANRRSLAQCPA